MAIKSHAAVITLEIPETEFIPGATYTLRRWVSWFESLTYSESKNTRQLIPAKVFAGVNAGSQMNDALARSSENLEIITDYENMMLNKVKSWVVSWSDCENPSDDDYRFGIPSSHYRIISDKIRELEQIARGVQEDSPLDGRSTTSSEKPHPNGDMTPSE